MDARTRFLATLVLGAALAACGVRVEGPQVQTPANKAGKTEVHVDQLSGDVTRTDKQNPEAKQPEDERDAKR